MGALALPLIGFGCFMIGAFYGVGREAENCGDGFAFGGRTSIMGKLTYTFATIGNVILTMWLLFCLFLIKEIYKILR